MNEEKVRKAIKYLAIARGFINKADKALKEEGFNLCTGIPSQGWQFLEKDGKYAENGIEELSLVLGGEVKKHDCYETVECGNNKVFVYKEGRK